MVWLPEQLGLDDTACRVSRVIARRSCDIDTLRDCTFLEIAAMTVFVASHLVNHPLTTEVISGFVGVQRNKMHNTYRLFYPQRTTIIDRECVSILREDPEHVATGSQPRLAWPPPGYADSIWELMGSRIRVVTGTAFSVISRLIEVSRFIFNILLEKEDPMADNALPVAALSMYLASELNDISLSYQHIARAAGVSEREFHTIYASFYPRREDLLRDLGRHTLWTDNDVERVRRQLRRELPPSIG